MGRYDIVVYGATGFTGIVIVRLLASEPLFKGKTMAVAGRSEAKLRGALKEIAAETGNKTVLDYPIILADCDDEESLAGMARQAKVIINAVGPYELYGEAVVRAAVNNGACHVDVSAEVGYLEQMELKYGALAKEKGVYIVGAFASIPADLGTALLKRRFDGTLAAVETCFRLNRGPAGYTFNSATYDGLLLGIAAIRKGGEAALHRAVMPKPVPKPEYSVPFRFPLSKVNNGAFDAWTMPNLGCDQAILDRSQYYDYHVNGQAPVAIRTSFTIGSLFQSLLLGLWLSVIGILAFFTPTRRLLAAHPDELSFGMFKKSGPTPQQMRDASFDYYIFGLGWATGQAKSEEPTKKMTVQCHGPDPGYTGAAMCLTGAALALIDDREKLPKECAIFRGGVYTTASAFSNTRIFEHLRTMGVTFDVVE